MLRMALKIQANVDQIVSKSPTKDESELARLNHFVWITFIMLPTALVTGVYNISAHHYFLAFLLISFAIYLMFTLIMVELIERTLIFYFGALLIYSFLLLYVFYHTPDDPSYVVWIFTYPLGVTFLFGHRDGFLLSSLFLICIIALYALVHHIHELFNLAFIARLSLSYMIIAFITSWTEYHRFRFEKASLDNEKALLIEQQRLKDEIERRTILEQELQHLARVDTLTGLNNRRYFMECANHELNRAKRYGHSVVFAILDIDHFKQINDRFGHPVGDSVLHTLGYFVKDKLRKSDIIGRLGGEEFAILLTHTDLQPAREKMETLRKSIENLPIDSIPLHVSVSIGLSLFEPTRHQSFNELYHEADQKLYQAKAAGRNCVF